MTTVLASAAVLAGAAFMFLAALGVARLPDLYTRMQAATKATSVGVVGVMCGVGLAFADASVTVRAVLIAGFFLLTAPVAAHAIARSAHTREVPLAPGTRRDPGAPRRPARRPRPEHAAAPPPAAEGPGDSTAGRLAPGEEAHR